MHCIHTSWTDFLVLSNFKYNSLVSLIEFNISDFIAQNKIKGMKCTFKNTWTKHSFVAWGQNRSYRNLAKCSSRISSIAVRHRRRIICTLKEDNVSPVNSSNTTQWYNTCRCLLSAKSQQLCLIKKKYNNIDNRKGQRSIKSYIPYRLITDLKTYLSTNRYISVNYINTVTCHRSVCKHH